MPSVASTIDDSHAVSSERYENAPSWLDGSIR